MGTYTCKKLRIEEKFQRLVYPLDQRRFARLEADILSGMGDETLIVWDGYLIDGFSQYQICQKHRLSFRAENMEFRCQEAVTAWICARQLKRSDIPESMRRFLIGMQYRAEAAEVKLFRDEKDWIKSGREPVCHQIAVRIGRENHVAWETVRRFSNFACSLEKIRGRAPKAAEKIMCGNIKIADKRLLWLSKLDEQSFQQELARLELTQQPLSAVRTNQSGARTLGDAASEITLTASVKDMPVFDPDAEVTGLTLTIPSWSGSIDRTISGTDLSIVSAEAKARLASALLGLQEKASEMLIAIGVK